MLVLKDERKVLKFTEILYSIAWIDRGSKQIDLCSCTASSL